MRFDVRFLIFSSLLREQVHLFFFVCQINKIIYKKAVSCLGNRFLHVYMIVYQLIVEYPKLLQIASIFSPFWQSLQLELS